METTVYKIDKRRQKLNTRMVAAMRRSKASNEAKYAMWSRWREVTGYPVYGLRAGK